MIESRLQEQGELTVGQMLNLHKFAKNVKKEPGLPVATNSKMSASNSPNKGNRNPPLTLPSANHFVGYWYEFNVSEFRIFFSLLSESDEMLLTNCLAGLLHLLRRNARLQHRT